MTITTDEQAIARLRALLDGCGKSQSGSMCLVLARLPGRGRRMRLAGRRSPLGDICSVTNDGKSTVCIFDALDVAAWCVARLQELGVEVEVRVAPEVSP